MTARPLTAVLTAVCLLLAAAPAAGAATVVVDDDGVQCPNAFAPTVQEGVDEADEGDTVAICPGTYEEAVGAGDVNGVLIEQPVTLKGAGAGLVTIVPSGPATNVIAADGSALADPPPVTISGVTVSDGGNPVSGAGIAFTGVLPNLSNSHVTDLLDPLSSTAAGVTVTDDGTDPFTATFVRNLIESYGTDGIALEGVGTTSLEATVTDNVIRGRGAFDVTGGSAQNGVRVEGAATSAQIVGNTISDNRFTTDERQSAAVRFVGAAAATSKVELNNLQNNGYGALNIDDDMSGCDAAVALPAPTNWWGHPGGPSAEAAQPAPCLPLGPGPAALGDRVNAAVTPSTPRTTPLTAPSVPGVPDDLAPTVDITSPTSPTVPNSSGVAVTATAGDDFDVKSAVFRRGSTDFSGTPSSGVYTATLPIDKNTDAGEVQTVTVTATDSAGQTTTDVVSYRVNDQVPTVTITSPADGATIPYDSATTISANPTDDVGVARVVFRDGSTVLAEDTTAPYSTSFTPGSGAAGSGKALTATAVDSNGQTATAAIGVRVASPDPLPPPVTPPADDAPPAVTITGPAANASIDPLAAPRITADASDDRGVSRVAFLDDGVVVCVDDVAPFECAYKPTGDDVGRNTLIAIAQDGAGQTGVDFRAVGVARFKPALTAATTPKRDKKRPYRYTTSGALVLPAGVTPAQACAGGGTVAVQFTAGKLKLPTTATLKPDCSYSTSIAFPSRRALGRGGRLSIRTSFGGNPVLLGAKAKTLKVRAG